MSKESTYNTLIFLSLICFAMAGSLSHFVNLGIILFLIWHYFSSKNQIFMEASAKKLYLALCAVFYIFIIRGIFHKETLESLEALSPMLPIPMIGLAILLTSNNELSIRAQTLQNYAKITVFVTLLGYLYFSNSLAAKIVFERFFFGRVEIFSGNPIPFSAVIFSITLFCLINWKGSKFIEKTTTIACLLIGFWLAGIASGTRGTLIAIIISIPILIWFTTQSRSLAILIPFIFGVILWLLHISGMNKLDSTYAIKLSNGIDTLLTKQISDNSMGLRMEMWSASVSTIRDNFFWGCDISNRFTALSTYLPETFKNKYSHPHNDLFASTIGAGFIGGILSIFSLLSPILAARLSKDNSKEKLFLGSLLTVGIMITANSNTVFFNDITAAWLAFSTFLIWNLNYTENFNQDGKV